MDKLTVRQFNLLMHISIKHKMDWFNLLHNDEFDVDYILDMENYEVLSLKEGISQLVEGVDGCDMSYLSKNEKRMFNRIAKKVAECY